MQVVRRPSPEPTAEETTNEPEAADNEKVPLLSLPAPPPTSPMKRLKMTLVVRTAKSCILVAKVLNVATLCPEGHLRTAVLIVVLILAVVDTWFDRLWVSIVFGLLHIFVVKCCSDMCS